MDGCWKWIFPVQNWRHLKEKAYAGRIVRCRLQFGT